MLSQEIEHAWNLIILSLQQIIYLNETLTLDNLYGVHESINNLLDNEKPNESKLINLKENVTKHKLNIKTAKQKLETSQNKLQILIKHFQKEKTNNHDNNAHIIEESKALFTKFNLCSTEQTDLIPKDFERSSQHESKQILTIGEKEKKKNDNIQEEKKLGRQYYRSEYNPASSIYKGSEVAYMLKTRPLQELIQCEVVNILDDGTNFELQDPVPDENNNMSLIFKANYKEILFIPTPDETKNLLDYPSKTRVLARYPETTTFYPATVIGTKKDGTVRLKFDGEEEVNKETEVERRLVLHYS